MDEKLLNILSGGANELGIDLDDESLALFGTYLTELKAWNRKINLTAIESDREIVTKHFLDSLAPCRYLGGVSKLLDLGAGGGFPGLPIKIAEPSVEVVLMDAVEKKVHFMRHIIRKLGLKGASAVAGRAEDPALRARLAGSFDAVISRAFTEIGGFLALAEPYLAPDGVVVAIKGPNYEKELAGTEGFRGFLAPEVHEVRVPYTDRTTAMVIFRKASK